MDCNDGFKPAFLIGDEVNLFVRVEVRQAPGRGHVLRVSDADREMGRSRGLEPPTPGTTNQCSNQLSYDRHGFDKGAVPWPRAPLKRPHW